MKRIALTIAILAAVVITADAGPLRRLFGVPQRQSCANGQCEAPQTFAAPVATPIGEPIAAVQPVEAEPVRGDLDPKSFAGALGGELAKKKHLTISEKHISRIINAKDSPKRDRQLARMESHTRVHLDLHPTNMVDWSTAVDWPTLLQAILQLLIKLLPLFL